MIIIASSNESGMAGNWEMPQGGGSALDAVEVSTPCLPRQLAWGPCNCIIRKVARPSPLPSSPVALAGNMPVTPRL